MQQTLALFESPEAEWKLRLAQQLHQLAVDNLFLGTSSWKYEGWLDQIYTRERYFVKGRFSAQRFDRESLVEYAELFPIVSGDFAFYRFPTAQSWRALFAQVPPPFRFAFKIPEDITVATFPSHPRYGARAGRRNPMFLSAQLLQQEFLDLLAPYADHVALLIFEFAAATQPEGFAQALTHFLAALPTNFRYAVEIRNPKILDPAYFAALRLNNVAHVFNSWTEMPALTYQMQYSESFTADFTAARALLRPGRPYEDSVRLFSPYTAVREPNAEVRSALRHLLERAKRRAEPTFIFVNNRLEGFAPGTIAAISEDLY